jgi:hypothetical protein
VSRCLDALPTPICSPLIISPDARLLAIIVALPLETFQLSTAVFRFACCSPPLADLLPVSPCSTRALFRVICFSLALLTVGCVVLEYCPIWKSAGIAASCPSILMLSTTINGG